MYGKLKSSLPTEYTQRGDATDEDAEYPFARFKGIPIGNRQKCEFAQI